MYSTQGIILKREDFRERDERVIFYTKDFGKLSVVAKGTKRIGAKLRGNLDIFNLVDIIFVEGKYFPILTGVELKDRCPGIGKDAPLYRTALCLAESIVYIFEDRDQDAEFFAILCWTMEKLSAEAAQGRAKSKKSLRSWLLWKKFQIAILENQGYGNSFENRAKALSTNAALVLGMLQGSPRKNARLARTELWDIEEMFEKTFAYFFNYSPSSWIPEIS